MGCDKFINHNLLILFWFLMNGMVCLLINAKINVDGLIFCLKFVAQNCITVLRRIVIIVFVLISVWMGVANGSYASVVSFDLKGAGDYYGEKYGNTSSVPKLGLTIADNETRTPYSRYADDGVELRFFEIRNIDFRLFLLYRLVQDERFALNAENENGIFIINSGNGMSGDDFYDAFEEFYNGTYADFQLLSKVDIAELFPIWKTNVNPRYLMSVLMDITISKSRSDNDHCINANPFCTSDFYEFESAYSDGDADEDADFGCIGAPRNPSWYFMRIGYSGPFVIHMEGHDPDDPNIPLDIDFCLWGPFTQQQVETGSACSLLTTDKIIDCSYSLAGVEDAYLGYHVSQHTSHYEDQLADGNITFHIPQSGEYYLLMITNFSNQPCTIDFNYASGTGTSDCTILPPMLENDGPYCVGDDIQLTANTTHYATYHWTGPNGFSSNLQNPTITNCTMANAGTYSCSIQVGSQQSSTASTQVIVYPQPIANFTATTVCQGSATQFTSTSTTNPSGQSISSYQWNFGDEQSGSGQSTTHTYATPGTYYATLTVSTGNGHCTDQITRTVTVKPQPTAGFTASTVCMGEATQFTNTSTGQNIISNQWDFGDGQGSTLQNPTHTYSQAGTYNVTLTVQAQGGCTSQISHTVTVNSKPTAGFTATTVCQGEATQFTNTSTPSGQTLTYLWDFGDGQSSMSQNPPSHTFAQPGTYQVTLTVSSSNGNCSDQITNTIIVLPSPDVTITVNPSTQICDGDEVTLTAEIDPVEINYVAPGDILCTDNTIVRPNAWPVSGKTAKGIVFYVDNSGSHGWAVSLSQSTSRTWGVTGLIGTAYNHWRDAIRDISGETNTQGIKASTNSTSHPAVWYPDASQGWYLPAIGQLNVLFGELVAVNVGLSRVGGTQITDNGGVTDVNGNVFYWSSTERSASSAYVLEVRDGQIGGISKTSSTSGKQFVVRAIIDF